MRLRLPSRPSSRLFLAAALVAPLFVGWQIADFLRPTFVVTIHDLNPKSLPTGVEDDGDTKDVVVKSRVKFKPGQGQGAGLDHRMQMKAKKDGGDASMELGIQTTGDMSAYIVVAVDSSVGLLDGQSLAFLERRPVGGAPVARLEAVWDAASDGLLLRGRVDGVQLGSDFALPGVHEATLDFADGGAGLELQGSGGGSGTTFGSFDQSDGLSDTAAWAWGCESLGPKGSFWFANLLFSWQEDGVMTGPVETSVLTQAYNAWVSLGHAADIVAAPPPHDLNALANYLDVATNAIGSFGAWGTLEEAELNHTLLPTTDGPSAIALAKGAAGWTFPAFNDVQALIMKGKTSGKPVKGHIQIARDKIEVLMGQLNGFKSNSPGKLGKAAELSIQ